MLFNKQVKKYMLTRETKVVGLVTLHRIKALKDFGDVKKGDLGGWIEKEENLSHAGDCWVSENALVWGNAIVYDGAKVYGDARVFGNAIVYGDAKVFGNAMVYGSAKVFGNARVYGDAELSGNVRLFIGANIGSNSDYIVIGPIGSRDAYTTVYRTQNADTDSNIRIQCGCFNGTPDEFFTKVHKTHSPQSSIYYKQYTIMINASIDTLNGKED